MDLSNYERRILDEIESDLHRTKQLRCLQPGLGAWWRVRLHLRVMTATVMIIFVGIGFVLLAGAVLPAPLAAAVGAATGAAVGGVLTRIWRWHPPQGRR